MREPSIENAGVPNERWGAVIVDTVVAGAVTALVIFKGSFYTDLSGFLDYIVVWLAPWFGVLLADYLLRKGRYDRGALAAERGGVYWRSGGINWSAIVALLLGMGAAMTWIDAAFYVPSYTGPLSNATSGADFSWVVGILVAGLAYWVLSFRSVPAEVAVSTSASTSAS